MGRCPVTPDLIIQAPGESERLAHAQAFCKAFTNTNSTRPRVLFGRNVYAQDLIRKFAIHAVVDDFCSESHFDGVPIIRSDRIPADAMVLALSGGRPLTVKDRLDQLGLDHLDYFAFEKHSGLILRPIVFNEGFSEDFERNRARYEWVAGLLADDISRDSFRKLISFRHKADLELLRGFKHRELEQYFEPFLTLQPQGEVFYDVGCFDGYTSSEFVRHCPDYRAVHAFEPEAGNIQVCESRLGVLPRIDVHRFGLSDAPAELQMSAAGSGSAVNATGAQTIRVKTLDSLALVPPTFLKMDIEGAEMAALRGARSTIANAKPKLAIAVYHYSIGTMPFWQVPELVLSIYPDYEIRLRHYTESIYETVMFFLPKRN